ncbi:MAG: DUF2236 domain-containing protein [Acidimicrobiia bacterium]|nr:DUF2236 domain-containing protein [Acidimicrobiia bacterium]
MRRHPSAVDAFPANSMIRRVSDEPAIGFGAGRALLLQLAHPHVAAGVAEHSDFTEHPFKRLQGTLEAVYTMVYGDLALAESVGRRVQWIHGFVTSPAYRANDPANLLWVHATLLDSALSCYERLVRPLSHDEVETYYEEMAVIAERFGCPRSEQPATYAAFRDYFAEQVEAMDVTDVGRRLSADVLAPKLPAKLHVPLKPLLAVQRLVAVGTLPEPIRRRFGFSWDDRRQRRLDRVHAAARAYHRAIPRPVRIAPTHLQGRFLLAQARRHVAAWEQKVAPTPTAT